jgi:hypothetical protein
MEAGEWAARKGLELSSQTPHLHRSVLCLAVANDVESALGFKLCMLFAHYLGSVSSVLVNKHDCSLKRLLLYTL